MLLVYLKIAIRNAYRNRVFSLINIIGLSFGLAICIYVATMIYHEAGYDTFHPDEDRLYRLTGSFKMGEQSESEGYVWGPVGPEMIGEISGIESICRVSQLRDYKVLRDGISVKIENIRFADPEFFDILGFDLLVGSPERVLRDPGALVLTENLANKLFGSTNPIGESFVTSNGQVLTVAGLMADPPGNTHIPFEGLLSAVTAESDPEIYIGWDGGLVFLTYCKLDENVSPEDVKAQFKDYLFPRINSKYEPHGWSFGLDLQRVRDIHLNSHLDVDCPTNRNWSYLFLLGSIALVILALALINYINLTSALAQTRIREVSMRKIMGANRSNIQLQILIESFVIAVLAAIISIVLIKSFYQGFNELTSADFKLSDYSGFIIITSILSIVIAAFLAGIFPSLILSRQKALAGKQGLIIGHGRHTVRNVLVVFQFFTAIVLIVAFILVNKQSAYLLNQDPGYNKDKIVSLISDKGLPFSEASRVKQALLNIPEIEVVSIASQMPGRGLTMNGYQLEGHDNIQPQHVIYTDQDFIRCFDFEVVNGRNFRDELEADKFSFLVNEAMIRYSEWEDPIGKKISRNGTHEIVGVLKDFHFDSMEEEVQPLIISCNPRNDGWDYYNFNIKYNTQDRPAMINKMQQIWRDHMPGVVFDYQFMDDYLEQNYVSINQIRKVVSIFSLLAILIAVIGLFGLSAFITQSRSKEIGIRKVNGANSESILLMLNIDMVKWILLAFILAIPVGLIITNKWLENYASRTNVSWWIFALAGVVAVALAIVTISWESFRIARKNPVMTLRYE